MRLTKRIIAIATAIILVATVAIPLNTVDAKAASSKYWIKVNKKANVATVYEYKNKKWVPFRAMTTSCGGSKTPSGTFHTIQKYKWRPLVENVHGQYAVRIVRDILFHSVWYYKYGDKTSQSGVEFNKLGKTASHGCVRLSAMDSKWVYDNCKAGTKVSIYSSSKPGPLGRPKTVKASKKRGWDPTDPDPRNPVYKLKGPTIKIKKPRSLELGAKVELLKGVTAFNPYANQDMTKGLKVYKVKYAENLEPSTDSTPGTNSNPGIGSIPEINPTPGTNANPDVTPGTDTDVNPEPKPEPVWLNIDPANLIKDGYKVGKYRVYYIVKDKYSGTSKKYFTFEVVEPSPATDSDADATEPGSNSGSWATQL